jgi:hypothetical protein
MAKPAATQNSRPKSTVAKISVAVRQYVTEHAKWNESIDLTLRRLLGRSFKRWLDTKSAKDGLQ